MWLTGLYLFVLSLNNLLQPSFSSARSHSNGARSRNITSDLKTQSATYLLACRALPGFLIPVNNGRINVTCVQDRSQLPPLLHHLNRSLYLSQQHLATITNRSIAYLERDFALSVCRLECRIGNPMPRAGSLATLNEMERPEINVGCGNLSHLRCGAVCSSAAFEVKNGEVTCSHGRYVGSLCSLRCKPGFQPKGATEKMCSSTAYSWHPELPFQCVATCPSIPRKVSNGEMICSDHSFDGSACWLRCRPSYRAVGNTVTICHEHVWTPMRGRCEKVPQCSPLSPISNGRVTCSDGSYAFSRCWLTCNPGFHPSGNQQKVCLPEGNSTRWRALSQNLLHVSEATGMSCIGFDANLSSSIICNIRPEFRTSCGNNKVTKELCLLHNCCWDNSSLFPCYLSPNTSFANISEAPTTTPPTSFSSNETSPPRRGNLSKTNKKLPEEHNLNLSQWLKFIETRFLRPINPQLQWMSGFDRNVFQGRPSLLYERCNDCNRATSLTTGPNCGEGPNLPQLADVVNLKTLNLSIPAPNIPLSDRTTRIFGGISATPGYWPWHAIVYFKGVLCGGTLIRDNLVLTAAHCVTGENGEVHQSGTVALGVQNISIFKKNQPVRDTRVQKISSAIVLRHENYTLGADGITTNDIAIIKLKRRAHVRGQYVKTLCLPSERATPSDDCYVTGFGIRSAKKEASSTLQQACLPIVSIPDCQARYQGRVNLAQNLCAGWTTPGRPDTCRGDSGGPLVCRRRTPQQNGRTCGWYLAGITSFGKSPCASGAPSVFVDVFRYRGWINRNSQQLENHAPIGAERRVS